MFFVLSFFTTSLSFASGLFLTERGVRTLGLGGAHVALSNDTAALWMNPAGLHFSKNQFYFDSSFLITELNYQREREVTQLDPNSGTSVGSQTLKDKTVKGLNPTVPIPTVAHIHKVNDDLTFAFGAFAPMGPSYEFPSDPESPQRYNSISSKGTLLLYGGSYASYNVVDWLQIGAGIEVKSGKISSKIAMTSGIPNRSLCASEQPECDLIAHINSDFFFSPGYSVGGILHLSDTLLLGVSYKSRHNIKTPANINMSLPTVELFNRAVVQGDSGYLNFVLPWSLKAGLGLKLEFISFEYSSVFDAWSEHKNIQFTPDNMRVTGIIGIPEFVVRPVTLKRAFKDTWSHRMGTEYQPADGMAFRAGFSINESAIPTEYISAAGYDQKTLIYSIGAGKKLFETLHLDVVFAYVHSPQQHNPVGKAALNPLKPVPGNYDPSEQKTVNAGYYKQNSTVIGAGFTYYL